MQVLQILIILGVIVLGGVLLYFWYAFAWLGRIDHLASELRKPEHRGMVIWTDRFMPRLAPPPPKRALWRMREGFINTKHGLVVTYKPSPEHIGNENLDDPDVIDAQLRSMEEHGRSVARRSRPF